MASDCSASGIARGRPHPGVCVGCSSAVRAGPCVHHLPSWNRAVTSSWVCRPAVRMLDKFACIRLQRKANPRAAVTDIRSCYGNRGATKNCDARGQARGDTRETGSLVVETTRRLGLIKARYPRAEAPKRRPAETGQAERAASNRSAAGQPWRGGVCIHVKLRGCRARMPRELRSPVPDRLARRC